MFDFRELKLMFYDPTDLLINNINKFLSSKKIRTKKESLQKEKIGKLFPKEK